ncbi:hypothetical protein ACHAXA_007432 [Cyclostephanos tholiformis]|uniref:Uncharacterized protein n=1 Tax=Cyclostephanos tholiformis TaxID=382380 RepID=A0ABD3SD14_9STRA
MSSSSQSSSGAGGRSGSRASLAQTPTFSNATEETISSANAAFYASWEESSDIRGDLATGWGIESSNGGWGYGGHNRSVATSNQNIIDNENMEDDQWGWRLQNSAVRPVPAFYPMDSRSTRRIDLVNDLVTDDISCRISAACQRLSIHGVWDNLCPTAALCSMELVEMEVNIYFASSHLLTSHQQASSHALLVEVQRRKGCPITFHNYRRCLLDAAEGKFDPESFDKTDGLDKPFGRDRCNQPRATVLADSIIARPTLSKKSITRPSFDRPGGPSLNPLRVPSFSADDAATPIAGLKSEERESIDDRAPSSTAIFDKAMEALNMAASLIKKDRIDARQVGIESLVLLTDPLRAGMETAKIASHVVLLGSAHEEITYGDDEADALFDASSGLGIRETILEMIMANDVDDAQDMMVDDADGFKGIEKEFTDSLINLCLTVLSNALHTIEVCATAAITSEDRKPSANRSPRPRASTEPTVRPAQLGVSKRFIDDTNSTFGCDVLSSLIRILGQARTNPHDAYHSARCLGVLFKGCGNSHKARARRDLDAKRIISAALEVGSRTHAKLADASRQAMVALVTDDEESMEEEVQEEETEIENSRIHEPNMSEQEADLEETKFDENDER